MHYPVMTEKHVADRWQVSLKTLRRWRLDGEGPVWHKLFRHVRYHEADVLEFEHSSAQHLVTLLGINRDFKPEVPEAAQGLDAKVEDNYFTAKEIAEAASLPIHLFRDQAERNRKRVRATSAAEKESINDDVVFEIELIKQVEINVDYILLLVEQYLKKKGSGDDKEIRATIERAINSSPSLRNKKDLIEQFVDSVNTKAKVDAQWQAFVAAKKVGELERIIAEENLNAEAARSFIDNAFRDGSIPTSGTAITKILPPVSRFTKNSGHGAKKQTVLDRLAAFFERYFGLA